MTLDMVDTGRGENCQCSRITIYHDIEVQHRPIAKHKLSPKNDFQDPEDYNYLNHVFTWNFPEVKDVLSVSFHFILYLPSLCLRIGQD